MQVQKIAGRDDAGAGMGAEPEQIALVAGDQEIGRAGHGDREKVVVVRIGRDLDEGQIADGDGEGAEIVHQAPGHGRGQPLADLGIAGDAPDLVQLLGRGQQVEAAGPPEQDEAGG